MIGLRTAISDYLKTLHTPVCYQYASKTTVYPYIVYSIPSVFSDGEGGETIVLDIDGYDSQDSSDTTALETMMEAINSLDKKTISTSDFTVTFYLDNKLTFELEGIKAVAGDVDMLYRRRYTYSGHLINKN